MTIAAIASCNTKEKNKSEKERESTSPNVLFIMVDDLRAELGCYGDSLIHSPNMDRLAGEGVLFESAYCNFPVCGASRASVLTGLRPTRERFLNYKTYAQKDAPNAVVLPAYFKKYGYTTISNGKIFHNMDDHKEAWDDLWRPSNDNNPFDYHTLENLKMVDEGTRGRAYESSSVADSVYFDGRIAAKTIRDLKKLKKEGKPFFLAAGFLKPHLPFNAPKKYWELYEGKVQQPDNNYVPKDAPDVSVHHNGELKNYREIPKNHPVADSTAIKLIQGYYACITYVDAQIGKVLQSVKDLGLGNNTFIVLMGDHGYNLQEHTMWCKHCNYKNSLRSTLIVKDPFAKIKGVVSKSLVEFVDVYPTLVEAAGLPSFEQLEGKSFLPLLNNPDQDWKPFVISKYNNGMTITTQNESYTEWIGKDVGNRMFYNHKVDPEENVNVSELPENQERIKELRDTLMKNWGNDF